MGYALTKFVSTKHKTVDIHLFFSSLLLLSTIFPGNGIPTDTLTQAKGISIGQTLISSGQMFELGFFSPGNSSKQYIGIWYKNVYAQKIVWVANRENPLIASDTTASLQIRKDGNLVLLDQTKNIVWWTNITSELNNTIAVLSDNGNLILKDNISGLISWESFNYPGDTHIAGVTTGPGVNHYLSSWKTRDDPCTGIFTDGLTNDTPPQNVVWKSSKLYWRSGPWDGSKFIGLPNSGVGFLNGFTVVEDGKKGPYITYNPPSSSHVAIAYLEPDGNMERSRWDLVTERQNGTWQGGVNWNSIEVFCDVYSTCGPFGVCNRNGSRSCECFKGFVEKLTEEWEKGNWTNGCVRKTQLQCEKNISSVTNKAKRDGFLKIGLIKLPDKYTYLYSLDLSSCEKWCLSNCSCEAYTYPVGIGCMVWYGDLVDTQQFSSGGADLFLRLSHSEFGKDEKIMKIIIALVIIISVIFLGVFLFGLYKWKANQRRKKLERESSAVPMFDFKVLAVATDNFSETNKLGVGGFGPVYKGMLENEIDIAVKRLSSHSGQGAEEFKNEIILISKLQHKNLVKLLGYCIKKDEKLLVYEYLKNKSLDTFLFDVKDAEQLDWDKHLKIINGIARGLLYLHRDSCLRIIHRDLKASNILLDDNLNPKISDFGLARAFQATEELANTNRVVGTFGYISPEYVIGGFVSEKSDVYSFGVLLLEIISGMRNTSLYHDGKYNLICYVSSNRYAFQACRLWEERKPLELMNKELSCSCPDADFIQCMHIGLLCVQDHAIDRPTMSTVVQMLARELDLHQPKLPIFYKSMVGSGLHSQSTSRFYFKDNIEILNL